MLKYYLIFFLMNLNWEGKNYKFIKEVSKNLKLKKKIEINKNQIIVVDSNEEGLKKAEIVILQNIKDGKVKLKNVIIKKALQGIGLIVLFGVLCNNVEKIN